MANDNYQQRGDRNFQNRRGNRSPERDWVKDFETKWITEGFDKNTVKYTDDFGKFLQSNRLTTSQIRNTYGELKRIQMKGFEKEKTAFYLLKPKMAYAVARDGKEGQKKLGKVFNKAFDNVENSDHYNNLMDFMEAVLAYHKSYGGK